MSEEQFDQHDIQTAERLARVEGKVDLILHNQGEEQRERKALWAKIDKHESRLTKVESERGVWSRVISGVLGFVGGMLSGIIGRKFFV